MIKFAAVIIALLISPYCLAAPYKILPSAAQLEADINRYGEHEVLWNRLWPNDQVFGKFLGYVETGNVRWLQIAAKLKGVSDAGASAGLISAVSIALVKKPANVLRLLAHAIPEAKFRTADICSGRLVFLEQPIQEMEWRKQARSSVSGVRTKELTEARKSCLTVLSE